MPKIELIDPAAVPMTGIDKLAVSTAMEQLQRALRGNQALVLRLDPNERMARFYGAYKEAAKRLNIGIAINGAEPRLYTSVWKGKTQEKRESSVLYIRITKASIQVPKAAPGQPDVLPRRPIVITDPIPTRAADGSLVSR